VQLGKAGHVRVLNDPWPWRGTLHGRPLTLADLIERGTLTPELVAVLAWTIAHGTSVFVAAGPQGAGKSTVANAILELLPDEAQVYVTSGPRDRLELPRTDAPTYLLINELSAHMSVYLSGPAVRRAFGLLQTGVRMLGTLHADNAAEAAAVLCSEADTPCADLNTAFVFVVLAASWHGQTVERRVVELGFLSPTGELTLLTNQSAHASSQLAPAGLHALAAWTGVPATEIETDLARRAKRWA
jgi:hypothetical protein